MKRRKFLKLYGFGLAFPPGFAELAHASGRAEVLLLTCMDYRFMDEVERFMTKKGYRNKYDHIVLAGASLGATDTFQEWTKVFNDHVELGKRLHGIKKVMVIDHQDCGAYKLQFGEDHTRSHSRETEKHAVVMQKMKSVLVQREPDLEFEGYLMSHNGRAERLV